MSHYITCQNCGEPECMDSDTGVHRRDDGTVCPDPRDAEVEGLRAELAAADRSVDRLSACVSNGDGNIRRLEREAEGLRAEVERLTKTIADQRCAYKSRAEAAEAEVERLKAEQAAAVCAWEEYARWPDLPSVPIGRVRWPDGREEDVALRPEQITGILRGIEKHVRQCLPYGVEAVKAWQDIGAVRAQRDEARAEVARLRAAATPEDAEERAAEVMWARAVTRLGDASLPWTAMSDDGHVKRFWREEARAVLAALRGDA